MGNSIPQQPLTDLPTGVVPGLKPLADLATGVVPSCGISGCTDVNQTPSAPNQLEGQPVTPKDRGR
jgi:hypothetical protein